MLIFYIKKNEFLSHYRVPMVYFNYKYLLVYLLVLDILRNYHWVTYKKNYTLYVIIKIDMKI